MSQWLALKCITRPQWVNDNVCIRYGYGLGAELATSLCRYQCTKMACGVKHYRSTLILEINDSGYCGPWPLLHEINMKCACLSKTTLFRRPTTNVPWNGSSWNITCLIKSRISHNVFHSVGHETQNMSWLLDNQLMKWFLCLPYILLVTFIVMLQIWLFLWWISISIA